MRRDDFSRKKCHRIKISGEKNQGNATLRYQTRYITIYCWFFSVRLSSQNRWNVIKIAKKNADVSFNVQIIGPRILLLLMIIGAIESDNYGCGETNADEQHTHNTLLDCRNNVATDQMASVQSFAAPLLCAYRNSDIKRYVIRITYTG